MLLRKGPRCEATSFHSDMLTNVSSPKGRSAVASPSAKHSEGLVGHLGSLVPLGRVGRVEEVAKAAVFLTFRRQQLRQRD